MAKAPTKPGRRAFLPKKAGFYPSPGDPEVCITVEAAADLLEEYTQEYRYLRDEDTNSARERRVVLSRELRKLADFSFSQDPLVDVTVPPSAIKGPFRIGERVYMPGVHRVPSQTAQVLLHMIDVNRRVDLDRMRQNGEEVDLGTIGDKATTVREVRV